MRQNLTEQTHEAGMGVGTSNILDKIGLLQLTMMRLAWMAGPEVQDLILHLEICWPFLMANFYPPQTMIYY